MCVCFLDQELIEETIRFQVRHAATGRADRKPSLILSVKDYLPFVEILSDSCLTRDCSNSEVITRTQTEAPLLREAQSRTNELLGRERAFESSVFEGD